MAHDLPKQLFPTAVEEDEVSRAKEMLKIIEDVVDQTTLEDRLNKLYWMRLISIVAVRLSLLASVWVFIFKRELWYGIPLFAVLCLLFGDMRDRDG